jgi:hypothetical protein
MDDDVETIGMEAVQAELRSYDPGTAAGVQTQGHPERRQRLWQRLDQLSGVRRPAATAPPTSPKA